MSRSFVLDDDNNPIKRMLTVGDSTVLEVLMQSESFLGDSSQDWVSVKGESGIAELKSTIDAEHAEEDIRLTLSTIELMRSDASFRAQTMDFNSWTDAQADEAIARMIATLPADRRPQVASPKPAASIAAPITAAAAEPAPMTVAAAATLASALARIRQDEIQAGWKKAAQHVAGQGKSTLSTSWARAVAKFTAEHNRKFRRNQ